MKHLVLLCKPLTLTPSILPPSLQSPLHLLPASLLQQTLQTIVHFVKSTSTLKITFHVFSAISVMCGSTPSVQVSILQSWRASGSAITVLAYRTSSQLVLSLRHGEIIPVHPFMKLSTASILVLWHSNLTSSNYHPGKLGRPLSRRRHA